MENDKIKYGTCWTLPVYPWSAQLYIWSIQTYKRFESFKFFLKGRVALGLLERGLGLLYYLPHSRHTRHFSILPTIYTYRDCRSTFPNIHLCPRPRVYIQSVTQSRSHPHLGTRQSLFALINIPSLSTLSGFRLAQYTHIHTYTS